MTDKDVSQNPMKVIELNDSNITISSEAGELLRSPGFARIEGSTIDFGEKAQQQARLHPSQIINQFWHRLSLDPLSELHSRYRHHGDIAYAHLMHLANEADLSGDVIFAVPGNFNRQQLSILLGLVGQCPFNAVALVDSAVVGSVANMNSQSIIHGDIQLHQTVLTKLAFSDGKLQRQSIVQIPETGLVALYDSWAKFINDAFIQQSRFNPQHNAETEQLLYQQLPQWLLSIRESNSIVLELEYKGSRHQAKLTRTDLTQKAQNIYNKILQQIETLNNTSPSTVLITQGLSQLPGFSEQINNCNSLPINAVTTACLENVEQLCKVGANKEASLSLVTSLPSAYLPANASVPVRSTSPSSSGTLTPSHIVADHIAYSLPKDILYIGSNPLRTGEFIELKDSSLDNNLCAISFVNGEYLLNKANSTLFVNRESITGNRKLQLGDCISFAQSDLQLELIQVL